MTEYKPQQLDRKWQHEWTRTRAFEVVEDPVRSKFYCLEMFAYPSGHAHVGHVRNYIIGDVMARTKRLRGFNVLHPFGWDAFGLPAENAAIKTGTHPETSTFDNIAHMKGQLQRLGISYAWEREIATCLPEYYKFNQWIFLKMFARGLAYRRRSSVNWCPSCNTVLANEQVVDGGCWRCGSVVESRSLEQWFFKITAYADELLAGLDTLDEWPEKVVVMQRNWIGRSDGATVYFDVYDETSSQGAASIDPVPVFTTRPDTLFGANYMVLAPEHRDCWRVTGHAEKLERVLYNLLENAVRHTPVGSTVTIRLVDEEGSIRVAVEDQGSGLEPGLADKLFERFRQGERSPGKAGLGLFFCRIMVKRWGGEIGCQPLSSGGAQFWFQLPKPKPHRPAGV